MTKGPDTEMSKNSCKSEDLGVLGGLKGLGATTPQRLIGSETTWDDKVYQNIEN